MAAASVSMCPASEIYASEEARMPTTTSTAMNTKSATSQSDVTPDGDLAAITIMNRPQPSLQGVDLRHGAARRGCRLPRGRPAARAPNRSMCDVDGMGPSDGGVNPALRLRVHKEHQF